MIDSWTEVFGVIGNPIRHSLSPILHNFFLKKMGLNGAYLAFEVKDLGAALQGIRGLEVRGVSVTSPFKTDVMVFLDEIDEVAQKIRAVNTILNREGKLTGFNTDWSGAIRVLKQRTDLKGKKVLLIGAGGASRAIGFGLEREGAKIFISNRSHKKGEEVASEIGGLFVSDPKGLHVDVLINTTPLGMYPKLEETPYPEELLCEGMIVMDVVYRPLETRLLRDARKRGCLLVHGLEMLLYQGVEQFEIWTGKRVKEEIIGEALSYITPFAERRYD